MTTMTPVATTHAAIPSSATTAAFRMPVPSQPELESMFFTTLQATSLLGGSEELAVVADAGTPFGKFALVCDPEDVEAGGGGEPAPPTGPALMEELCVAEEGAAPACVGAEAGAAPVLVGAGAEDPAAGGAPAEGAAEALTGGAALAAAGAEAEALGAALADGAAHGGTGGAANEPALEERLGSGSALFE
jgi:hypothetical protein